MPRSGPPPVDLLPDVFVVEIQREELERRIDRRLAERLDSGMIAEVQGLLDAGVPAARLHQLGLEYREITAHLEGTKSRERMVDDLRRGIRRLAKRQRTWFRGLPRRGVPVTPIGPDDVGVVMARARSRAAS